MVQGLHSVHHSMVKILVLCCAWLCFMTKQGKGKCGLGVFVLPQEIKLICLVVLGIGGKNRKFAGTLGFHGLNDLQ